MNLQQFFEITLKYAWPLIVAWNIFLFQKMETQEKCIADYKIYVAENYLSKSDLERMFQKLEDNLKDKIELYLDK